jgi:hypothetical protein
MQTTSATIKGTGGRPISFGRLCLSQTLFSVFLSSSRQILSCTIDRSRISRRQSTSVLIFPASCEHLHVARNARVSTRGKDGRPMFEAGKNSETNVIPQTVTNSVLTTVRFRYAGTPLNPESERVNTGQPSHVNLQTKNSASGPHEKHGIGPPTGTQTTLPYGVSKRGSHNAFPKSL